MVFLFVGSVFAQRADLSGLKFCIDPGHGGHNAANDRHVIPDPGTDFWESESNFQKALLLKSLLEAQGATIILTRYTNDYPDDNLEPSLAARVALANANNVDWFHSIHSNATGLSVNNSINYTLMLVREMRPGGPASSSGNGLGVPETQEAWDISVNYMSPNIRSYLRTQRFMSYLDWTFYGGTNGGFSLGVLRGLLMPGELSEGSMHDYYPETRRLMNNDYRKMEAYALRNSFMQYFLVPADTAGIIAGIQTEIGTNRLINYSKVLIMPENREYTGDQFNNGFYMFDGLQPGSHTIRFETPGYGIDSIAANVSSGAIAFVDKFLESLQLPTVLTTFPAQGDTMFSAGTPITMQFSKPMDTVSVRNAFSISPPVTGRFSWANANTTLTFRQDSVLPYFTYFTVRIDTSARSSGGQLFDGNGDGIGGDPFVLQFRTSEVDVIPPRVVAAYPASDATLLSPTAVLDVTFDEPLNPTTVNPTNFALQKIGPPSSIVPRTLRYWEDGRKGGVNVYLNTPLEAGQAYRLRISGVADLFGNPIQSRTPLLWQFSVAPGSYQYTTIESFDSSVANWWQPSASGSTVGIDSATFAFDTTRIPVLPSDMGSAQLRYSWQQSATDWLIREYVSSGAPRAVQWQKENTILQVYVNGDGSGNQFRFAIDDSVEAFPGGSATNHEVSRWHTIDWVGWRLVECELEHDSVGTWIGNGILEGKMRFDSFQLRYVPGSGSPSGRLYFDQLQVATRTPEAVDDGQSRIPETFALDQNYPNPFNPTTIIRYQVPLASHVRLLVYDLLGREVRTLVNDNLLAGRYAVEFSAAGLASGMYIYRLESGGVRITKKMLLTK